MDIRSYVILLFTLTFLGSANAQVNLGNRRVHPPRIAPTNPRIAPSNPRIAPSNPRIAPTNPRTSQQQQQQQQQRQLSFRQFPPSSPYFNTAILARRLNTLETELRRISGSVEAVGSNVRVTLSQTLTERLAVVRQEVSGFDQRIGGNEAKVESIQTEMKYLKNSNAHMQRRLDRLEESQRRHDESIQSLVGVLETIQQDSAAPPPGVLADVINRTEFSRLAQAVERVKLRMNDSDVVIGGYASYFQSFADNLGMLSKKTETLQLESSIVTETLSEINENIYNIQNQMDNMNVDEDAVAEVTYGSDVSFVDDIQSAVDELTETLRDVEVKQQLHSSSIQNLTRQVASSSNYLQPQSTDNYRVGTDNSPQIRELTASVEHLENALTRTNEDQRLTYGQVQLRMSELKADFNSQQDEVTRLAMRLDGLQQTQTMNDHIRHINDTLTRHDQILLDLASGGPPSFGSAPFNPLPPPDVSSIPINSTILINGNSSSFGHPGGEEGDLSRIDQLEEYLTNSVERNIRNIQEEFVGLQYSLSNYGNRMDEITTRMNHLESGSPLGAVLRSSSIDGRAPSIRGSPDDTSSHIDRILSDVEALNASVSAQSNMLAQGFRQLGDYDRRLRTKEFEETTKHGELQEIRILLQNATMSLSQMSMTIAEHELTIPNIFDSINTGQDIIIDLNNEMYKHEMALQSMNKTINDIEKTISRNNPPADNQATDSRSGVNNVSNDEFVTRRDFDVLAEGLAALTNSLSPRDLSLPTSEGGDVTHMTSQLNRTNSELIRLGDVVREIRQTVDLQQNAISHVTQSTDLLRREMSDVRVSSHAGNTSQSDDARWALEAVKSGMRRLTEKVAENRKILGNQRRRFRIFEFLKRSCARHSDVTALNETISAELHSLHHAMESVASNVTSFSEKLPTFDDLLNSTSNVFDCDTFDVTSISDLVEKLRNLTKRVDELKLRGVTDGNVGSATLNIPDELLHVPTTLRLLESQIQSFQDVVVALPSLDNKIEALKGLRNLVFQNSQGISTFHTTLVDVESSIVKVRNDFTKMEANQMRLEAYHDDLRSNLNVTRRMIDSSDDRSIEMSRAMQKIERSMRGNFTELRDEAASAVLRLNSLDDITTDFTLRIAQLETDLEQELLTLSIRHNDLDNRASRMKVSLDDVIGIASDNSDVIDKFNRSLRDERTLRARTDGEQENILLALRESLLNLEGDIGNHKSMTSQYETRLAEQEYKQQRNKDEIARAQKANQDTAADVRSLRNDVISSTNDVTLLNDRVNNVEDGMSDSREALTSQSNSILQIRQNFLNLQNELNGAKQTLQIHESFKRRAEQMIDKHRNDISFILEHSSNHTVAIERLRQRVGSQQGQAFSNLTQDILNEVELLEANLQAANAEISSIKRQASVRDATALDLESSVSDLRNSALEYQNKIRTNKEMIDRNKNSLNRLTSRLDDVERIVTEQRLASADLQQVVVTNRNEISLLGNLQTSVERTRDEFARIFSLQENRTNTLRQTVEGISNRVSGIQNEVVGHERELNAMRQDRISLDADIDQIYRSSGSLEEILRKTTSDVQGLQRDFESSSRQLSTLGDLEKRTTDMQGQIRDTKQTISSNENKISRLQGAVERMGNTLDRTIANVDQQHHSAESRDRARTNEIREIRQGLDRFPTMLRSVRNELTRHSERIRSLHERIIEVDGRINSRPQTNRIQPQAAENLPQVSDSDEISLEASGWLPVDQKNRSKPVVSNQNTQSHHVTFVNNELVSLVEKITWLETRMDELNATIVDGENLLKSETLSEIQDKLLSLEGIYHITSDAVSSLGGDVYELSQRVSNHDNAGVQELANQVARIGGDVQTSRRRADNAASDILRLQMRVEEVETNVNQGLANHTSAAANLSESVKNIHDVIQSIYSDVNRNDVSALRSSIEEVENEMQNFVARFANVTSQLARTNQELTRKSGHDHVHGDVVSEMTSQMDEFTVNVTRKLNKLVEKYEELKSNSTRFVDGNHGHESLQNDVSNIMNSIREINGQVSKVYEDMRNGTSDLIGRIELVENKADNHKMEIDYLSEQMVQNTDKLEAQKQRTNSIAERVGELESGNNQQISSAGGVMAVDEVRQALVKLTGALARRNATAWSLSQRSSSIEFPLEGDYAVYQEVEPASEGVGTEVDFYSLDVATAQANTSLQEFLKETNSNIGHLTSNLITALRAISGSFSADPVGPTMHQEPPRNHGNHDAFGAVILDFSDRLVDVEMLVLSMNASMHLTSQDGGNELDKIVELSQNITDLWTLVDQLQTNGREKETLIHTALQKVDDVRDDVASHGANIFNVLSDIKYFNTTIQELSDTQGVQHYVLGNMLQQQEQHTSDLQRWRRQMDEIGVESSHALSTATNATNKCNKLDTRIDRELSGLQSQIAENRNNLGASLAENFTAIRNGLEEAKNMARSLGEEMRQRFEEKEHPSISEIQLEHIDNQINDFYRRQQDMETSLRESDIRFLSMEDQITEINELIPLLSNDTRQRVQQVVKFLGSEIEEVEKRSLLHLSDLQNTLSTLTATLMSEDQKMANLLNSINATVWVNSEDLAGLTRTINNLLSQDQNTQLALMRHSTELKGFTRTFRTIEDLIRTVTETVTLNSNQITIITGDLQTSSDRQTTTMDLVTDMLSNHSIEIEHLTNQISALAQDIHNRASVHVVIPNKNPAVSRFSTVKPTTAPTTTVSSTTTTALPSPTTPLGPVPEPTGLSVLSSTATELTMSWLPVEDPSVDEYRVIVQNIHGAHASSEVVTSSPPATIGNLDPGSRYLITLYSSRNGELSKPLNGLGETLFRPSPRPAVPTTTTTLPALPTPGSSTPDSNAISVSNDYSNQVNIADMADFYCDFETSGLCNFLDDTSDDFDWMRNNGTTPSSDTGPSRDHTLGSDNGHYMFIEASRPRQPGDKARLVSPLMEPTSGQCLEFYYHMFGVGTGELQVHMQHAGARTRTQVWADIGNHGDQWKRAKTTISSDLPFQIVFEGIRGTDYHSDIAFDDVIIKPGACPKPMLQCGFEDDTLCGFTQDSNDDFDWTQNTGATSSADTGPITDHTLGGAGGHYIYLEASNPRYPGDITRISSPTLNPTNAQCLQFYYHMHGVDIGSLKVYLRQTSQPNDLGIAIWSKHGSQGNDWILGRTSILSTEAFQIVFEGSRGDDYHGDIALDDVVITDGFCDQPVCPVGRKFGDLCYKVEETGRTYQDASAVCKSNGGLLAAVKTQEQQNFLVDMVSGYGNEWTLFWIGLDDKVTEGRFVYSDDMPLAMSDRSFGAWAAGEPNDALGDEDCVNMEYQSKQRRWNDVPCNRENWFICQYPVSM